MKNLLSTLLFCFTAMFYARAQTFDWVNTAKIFRNLDYFETDLDGFGNTYSAGIISDSIHFDSVPTGIPSALYGNSDSYLLKLDTTGQIEWLGQLNGRIFSFTVDKLGNMYIFLFYFGTIDADPGSGIYLLPSASTSTSPTSNAVLKIDPNGNLIWAKNIISDAINRTLIEVDDFGNIYFVVKGSGKIDLDPSLNSSFSPSLISSSFLFKWDTDGNFIWGGGLGGFLTTDLTFNSLEIKNNRFILTGNFTGTVDFNLDTTITNNRSSANFSNLFILGYDTSGAFQWVHDYPKLNNSEIFSPYLDSESNIYLSGAFQSAMDFNFGAGQAILAPTNGQNVFILKMDSAGSFLWVKHLTSLQSNAQVAGIETRGNNSENIYITGYFNGMFDLDPVNSGVSILNSSNRGGTYTLRYSLNGDYQDSWTFRGSTNLSFESLRVGNRNNLTYIGRFNGTADFDPSSATQLRTTSNLSLYFLRLNQCFETNNQLTVQSCGTYTPPSGNYNWTTSGTYTDTIPNHMGCDSVLDISLSIINTDTTLFLLGNSIGSNEFSATFQWLDCDANYSVIPSQTRQLFTPTQNGNYALELTKNGCVDTTACFNYMLVGQQEFSLENSINVFPNPSNGVFNLIMKASYDRLIITDISGRVILTKNESPNLNTSIDLSFYENGIYFMEVISKGERIVKKLIKH